MYLLFIIVYLQIYSFLILNKLQDKFFISIYPYHLKHMVAFFLLILIFILILNVIIMIYKITSYLFHNQDELKYLVQYYYQLFLYFFQMLNPYSQKIIRNFDQLYLIFILMDLIVFLEYGNSFFHVKYFFIFILNHFFFYLYSNQIVVFLFLINFQNLADYQADPNSKVAFFRNFVDLNFFIQIFQDYLKQVLY